MKTLYKSPFFVISDFLPETTCTQIIDKLEFYSPDVDVDGNPIKMIKPHEFCENIIYKQLLQHHIDNIMQHYDTEYSGTEEVVFEYLAEGISTSTPICENSNYVRKKWVRTKQRDLTGVLFLNEYSETPPFDPDSNVMGGKLEFPQHGFSFNPIRGTLVIYPSGPHFINASSAVLVGDAIQARFHIATKLPFIYDPKSFPGDYTVWFKK